jgi:hypothetical protein
VIDTDRQKPKFQDFKSAQAYYAQLPAKKPFTSNAVRAVQETGGHETQLYITIPKATKALELLAYGERCISMTFGSEP